MIIMTQSGKIVFTLDNAYRFFVLSKGGMRSSVNAVYKDGSSVVCGEYNGAAQAELALGQFFYAVRDGEPSFEFPQAEEMPQSKAHYGTMTSRKRSHGGS